MILSHSKKFIFVHLYKTGGTSIRRRLEKYDSSYNVLHWAKSKLTKNPVLTSPIAHKHAKAKTIRGILGPEIYDNYYSFCFVRNPWDWQVSLYHYIVRGGDPNNQHNDIINGFQNFTEYIHWRCAEDVHFQMDYVQDENGKQIVDYIGRMENLNEDFKKICQHLDLDVEDLPHLNKSVSKKYQEFYTPETRDLVYNAYQPDIDFFGYEF